LAYEGSAIDPYPLLKDAYMRSQEMRAAAMRASMVFGEDKLA
jgi:hypothetical protein